MHVNLYSHSLQVYKFSRVQTLSKNLKYELNFLVFQDWRFPLLFVGFVPVLFFLLMDRFHFRWIGFEWEEDEDEEDDAKKKRLRLQT